ncbi:hypothetical protein [Paracnuella aquatica]|uniref:hypothetical protein n=1 Tax=Paracnuella aquatica TaxID=2268757 RepID=UPI0012D77DB7|nr:hypothetical protein [Paracnuella aquatica]
MNTKEVPYVNKEQQAKRPTSKATINDGDVKGYGSLSLEEQLELFADLIVEQLLKAEKP